VHGRDVAFGWTSLDDLTLVAGDQPFLTSPGAWWRAWGRTYFHVVDAAHAYYRPLVTASYALNARASGAAPRGYHLTNVALHLAATALVHALFTRARFGKDVALLGALAFAVHPALVAAVAWVPGRNDSLLAVFALLAVLTHARALSVSEPGSARALAWRGVHLACFALAMFTKETAIVVPLVCVAWTWLVERPSERPRTRAHARADVVASGLGWASVVGAFAYARHHALAAAASVGGVPEPGRPLLDWRALAHHGSVLVSSAGKIVVPLDLAPIATIEDTPTWPGVAAFVAIAIAVLVARRAGAVRMRVVAFGAVLYALALVPTLFTQGQLVLDNRLYLPAVGVLFVLGELARAARVERPVLLAFGAVTAIALAALALGNASAYRDPLSFGKAAVAGAPRSALARFTLGQASQLRGELDAAAREYAVALAIDPSEPIVHNNLAVIAMRRGDWTRAEAELEAELRVNPGYPVAIENLAIVRRRLPNGAPSSP
jgi:hypothetical protein